MKTDIEIKDEVYAFVRKSDLMERLNGELSKTKRTAGSKAEDVTVSVIANENGKIQEAVVIVNIYIPDAGMELQREENTPRLREICRMAADFFEVVKYGNVRINLETQRVYEAQTGDEHVISNRLSYKVKN